jgi:hypothetical protein
MIELSLHGSSTTTLMRTLAAENVGGAAGMISNGGICWGLTIHGWQVGQDGPELGRLGHKSVESAILQHADPLKYHVRKALVLLNPLAVAIPA